MSSDPIRFTGFPFLSTPQDLLPKLKDDIQRMDPSRSGSYAMYDFYITADNLCDWWHEYAELSESLRAFRSGNPLRKVVAHIANSAKHYKANDPRHQSVENLYRDGYVDDYVEEGYFEEPPTATLEDDIANQLGISKTIELQKLAELVYNHWEAILSNQPQ